MGYVTHDARFSLPKSWRRKNDNMNLSTKGIMRLLTPILVGKVHEANAEPNNGRASLLPRLQQLQVQLQRPPPFFVCDYKLPGASDQMLVTRCCHPLATIHLKSDNHTTTLQ